MSGEAAVERWTFGESPLPATVELAAAVRDLMATALAVEHPSDELRAAVARVVEANRQLAGQLPADLRPRVGPDAGPERRVYLDHSRDVGEYNACFPRYELQARDDRAEGRVEFPIVYEGPPGIVHGGFLALFFDCVLQQLNCDLGVAGKTRTLALRYRRPVPILTELEVVARRSFVEDRIESSGELLLDGTVMCAVEMSAVRGERAALPTWSPRRPA
jgi:hypothetical protein